MEYNLPTLVSESTRDEQASHLKIVLAILEVHWDEDENRNYKAVLISIVILILSEREILPVLLLEHVLVRDQLQAKFAYNKNLCEDVAKGINIVLESAKSSLLRIQMSHASSDLSFGTLATNYGKRQFKITFISTRTASNTRSCVFDMGKCVSYVDGKIQLDYQVLREYSHRISDSLLYPILSEWWQEKHLYTQLPYILGIPEECILMISKCFRRKDANNLRLASRRMTIVPKRIY